MGEDDYRLSMAVSRRPRTPRPDEADLRALLIHRLTDTTKAVGRISLRDGAISVFCEGCHRWVRVEEFPLEWDCPCGRSYATELVVLEEINRSQESSPSD